MKRGKDDEKIMGPMFPRLHVNDTDKGGPRAPPRNKMALYEQLSVPTQKFSPAVLPLNPSNTSCLVPPVSSSQGNGLERNLLLPHTVPHSTPTHLAEIHTRQPAGALNSPLPYLEQRKKVGDDEDFTVPVYCQSRMGQGHSKSQNDIDRGKLSPSSPTCTGQSIKSQNVSDKDPMQSSSSGLNLRPEERHQFKENPENCISGRDNQIKSSSNLSKKEKIDGLAKKASVPSTQECGNIPRSNLSRLNDTDASLQQDSGAALPLNDGGGGDGDESTRDIEKGVVPQPTSDFRGDKTYGSVQLGSSEKSDNGSETSMVESISDLDISPDDVVGMIGHKRFWKARKAIVNQQRVFAVQVFELHRLIKVQQLIAGSPHLLLEDSAYLGKPSLKASPAKKLSSEYVVKPLPHIVKRKDDPEKPNHKMECSAENAVGKMSPSSVKKGSQPSNYGPYFANPPPAPLATDSRVGPWCFHQSSGHQWLVPIMSPSEGLVYKPYPGHGFIGTVCGGGCAPFGSTPMPAHFMNTAYGIAAPLPHQGMGVMPGVHSVGNGYFPPYGMPVMNTSVSGSAAEQKNQFAEPGQHNQLSQWGVNFNMQHESSCDGPAQKNGAILQVMQFQASKDTELQGSTASSPGERLQGDGTGHATEGREALQLAVGTPQPHDTDQPTKVIKVVPHNPRSATESAARIFQSIQEERKQYDSI